MIIKSNILINYADQVDILNILNNYSLIFDIDFNISNYDYFDLEEYKKLAEKCDSFIEDDYRLINILESNNFLYEVDIGTSFSSIEKDYLPVITDFIAQNLSLKLRCNTLTSFRSSKSDDYYNVSFFNNGKEKINLSSCDNSIWNGVLWCKIS